MFHEWMNDARCVEFPSELWFPDSAETIASYKDARKVCDTCKVAAQCLQYAEDNSEKFGMWGGLAPTERNYRRRMTA